MNWLINRKKYKPFIYIITIVVYAANMALLMICVRFAYCIMKGIQTDWYNKAVLTASRDDLLFADQSPVVFFTLSIVFVFIILFALLVILGYRSAALRQPNTIIIRARYINSARFVNIII